MPLRTISLALIANSDPDPAAAVRYALDLAGRTRAHLLARIGAPPLVIPPLSDRVSDGQCDRAREYRA